jgi:Domain of unknown function (DUF1413)
MIDIKIPMEEQLLYRLLADACANNISLQEQILKTLHGAAEAPKLMSSQAGLDTALERAEAKTTGEEFTLEDLFSDEEWDQIPSRRVFGRQFRQAIESTNPQVAHHERKTATNKAVYKRR